ncbi:serine/threonine protein kinase [Phormidesmis sp. 146-12]
MSDVLKDSLPEILHDRYHIQKQLGKKAGRLTLLAQDLQTGESVVIKRLTFSSDFTWDDLKLFERETETLRSLSHPSIPGYVDSFEIDTVNGQGFALVQSYIEARSLEDHLKAGRRFSELEVKQIVNDLLGILDYLHSRQPPVIHRDIKPSNVLLTDRSGNSAGQVYLVDFGSVQTLATREGQTVTVVGTYGYMPPEQFGGLASAASDLYSLGATAIALLTGMHPADLPQRNLCLQFEKAAQVSPEFGSWIKQATAPSVEKRFTSARSALQALNQPEIRHLQPLDHRTTNSATRLILDAMGRSVRRGLVVGAIVSVAISLLAAIPTGGGGIFIGIFLAPASVACGVLLGVVNGLLIGTLTRLFFFPLKDRFRHRRVATIASLVVSILISVWSFLLPATSNPNDGGFIFSSADVRGFAIPSVVCIVISMGFVSYGIVNRWYDEQNQKELGKQNIRDAKQLPPEELRDLIR